MSKIIGIDLGTTNSEAAYLEAGTPKIIPSAEGSAFGGKMFPSVVAFTKDGERLVGEPAKRQAVLNPDRTIMQIKRKMGTDYTVTIDDRTYTPQEISAIILQKIKADAEAFLGEEVTQAVITVPAYFNDNQRQATKDAGTIAGLEVLRLINEPTAAAIAYGLGKGATEAKIAVLDLGGGTFDVTLMEMGDGVFEVVSTNGDTRLGGMDMDEALMDWLLKEFKDRTGVDLSGDRAALQRLRDAAEKAKIELTGTVKTSISLPFLAQKDGEPLHLELELNRAKMEEMIRPILDRTRGPIEQAFKDAKWKVEDVDNIILVGGPTRMPVVREHFEKIIGRRAERGVDPMQCVAMGAAVQAGVLAGEVKDLLLLDVTPLSLGVETLGGVFTRLIERNTTIPVKKAEIFSTAADGQTTVEIHVLQGERSMASDNTSLGRFHLVGIPPAPRGIPQIEVTFDIDASGILHVNAKDMGTGKEQEMTITAPMKLDDDEIQRMITEAEEHAEEDRRRREEAETRNQADSMTYATEKMLEEMGDQISEDTKKAVEEKIRELREALEGEDLGKLKSAMEALNKESQKIGMEIYQKAQASQATAPPSEGEEKDVVDAEFEESESDD
jgi:molecular chaperone DnaK